MDVSDYYADLNLDPTATLSQIKGAFQALARQHHPDKSGDSDTSAFRRVREAYEKLSDGKFKAEYDRNYHSGWMRVADDVGAGPTRTAAYEAEVARETDESKKTATKAYEEMMRRSPPPKQPAPKFNESKMAYYHGRAYTAWVQRDEAYRTNHPTYGEA
ncbi:hypothetical protein ACEQ8H_000936 [Pleosporales sp. CAS-2024a]